ncbi:MAG: preprotein translocase subunit SecY [Nanoarchaeota archaeon]|nr:preprotein translocase subunit SecY [Nanoarchaeota archaeon]
MSVGDTYISFLQKIPGITNPIKRMTFKDKLKWTAVILLLYFVMSQISIYGIAQKGYEQFQFLEVLLGSSFGSLISLGIGPIVTSAILLQLLVGSKILPWDLKTDRGKSMFQGTQKLLAILLCFIEGAIYVTMGAVPAASPAFVLIVVMQLAMGGILLIFMDEVISKWGFGSGVGLFIVAGVAKTMIIRSFNPLTQAGTLPTATSPPSGIIPFSIATIGAGDPIQAFFAFLPIIATVLVFLLVVYSQSIRVEVPLAFSSIRGFGRRWPLKFFYTSNIPVILVAALLANVQLMARMVSQRGGMEWLGTFDAQGNPVGGLVYFLIPPMVPEISGLMISIGLFVLVGAILVYFTKKGGLKLPALFGVVGGIAWYVSVWSLGLTALAVIQPVDIIRLFTYSFFMIGGATLFAVFWMNTSGMDPKSVAEQIESTGMQIPGYRRDIRIIERVLGRYIPPLTIIGGAAVGFLAAFADFTGAIGTGTGILLATMIIYQLYEEIAQQHMEDMHPAIRKLMGK